MRCVEGWVPAERPAGLIRSGTTSKRFVDLVQLKQKDDLGAETNSQLPASSTRAQCPLLFILLIVYGPSSVYASLVVRWLIAISLSHNQAGQSVC